MNPIQAAYNFFRGIKTPAWLRELFQTVQTIIAQTVYGLAKEYVAQIEAKIIEVAPLDIPNQEKFRQVFNFSKGLGIAISDTALNILINAFYLRFKHRAPI